MKPALNYFILTVLCVTLIYTPPSFAQNFVEGQMPDIFLSHRYAVNDIKFSPDGKLLASGGTDRTIKLWDVATSTLKTTLEGPTRFVNSVAFSPDGKLLASGSDDDTVKLWDVTIGTLKATLTGHEGNVNSVAFSPDGKLLASGSDDNTVKLWDVATRRLKATLKSHTNAVVSVAFSPDGKTIASGSRYVWDERDYADYSRRLPPSLIKLWNVATRTLKDTLGPSLIYHPDNKGWLNGDRYLYLSIVDLAFSPDSTTLACSVQQELAVYTWRIDGDTEFQMDYAGWPGRHYVYNDNGTTYLLILDDNIELWDVASGALKAKLELTSTANSVAFSPDGRTLASGSSKDLASGSSDNTVKLWNVTRQSKAPKATLSAHGDGVTSVVFSPDGSLLASGSEDGAVRLWKALPPANGEVL